MKLIINSTIAALLFSLANAQRVRGGDRRLGQVQVQQAQPYIDLTITNLAYQQPFGGFLVMTHNDQAAPLFTLGQPSSEPLARLAEDGNPQPLVDVYTGQEGVGEVFAFTKGAPYFLGGSFTIPNVPVTDEYPYVTIASMAINTNDCFVAINGMKLEPGDVVSGVGYDSGTEVNNELCSSIPGPACDADTGNVESGNGEGYVHVHRGFFGVGSLSEAGYDWRNPMVRIEVSEAAWAITN